MNPMRLIKNSVGETALYLNGYIQFTFFSEALTKTKQHPINQRLTTQIALPFFDLVCSYTELSLTFLVISSIFISLSPK